MEAFYHHSRSPRFRDPQGAAPCGTAVTLRCRVGDGFSGAAVFLRLWRDGAGETLLPMTPDGDGLLSASFVLPEAPGLIWYYFVIRTADGQTQHYGGTSGAGSLYPHEPPAWRITVYRADYETPAWFCEGLAYQIFPDRFRRSSWEAFRSRAEAHRARGRTVRLHDRWSEEPAYLPATGSEHYEPNDFFGGDLNGIREKLPYLHALGVTCLYLNPIFESASNHRYDTADYLAVDPLLGTEADLRALCREARALGIRIMLDGVFSHTGRDSRYFDHYGRYGTDGAAQREDSPYRCWYRFSHWPDRYECWWDFPSLPNVEELTPSYAEFIAGEHGVLSHWADCGATSWRLDVADELPDAFIKLLRRRVKANDPDGVLLGEVWEECSDKHGPQGRRAYVEGDALDSAMNYPFAEAVLDFVLGRTDAYALAERLLSLAEWYPPPFWRACLNLLSSHDIERAATRLSGAPRRQTLTRKQQAAYVPTESEAQRGRARFLLAAAIQMFAVGVPCVYYGDEAGMTGMGDPFNRRPYPWGREESETHARMALLMRLRHDLPALKRGRCRMGALNAAIFGLLRYTEDGALALLFVNTGEEAGSVRITDALFAEGRDAQCPLPTAGALTDEYGRPAGSLSEPIALPPHAATIRILTPTPNR